MTDTGPGPARAAAAPPHVPASPGVVLFWVVVAAIVIGRLGGPLGGWVGAAGTAAHEVGHAATADVLTGDVVGITIFSDGGGVTVSELTDSGWRRFVVAGSGYPATLVAALLLLTGAILGRTGRRLAAIGAVATTVALLLWVPLRPAAPGITSADQRFTWITFAITALLLTVAAVLPDRWSTARRIVLGTVAVGLLSDAFRSVDDLITMRGRGWHTTTDAETLFKVTDLGSAAVWAWLMRLFLLLVAAGWAWWLFTRWAAATTTPPVPAPVPRDEARGGE